MYYEKMMMCAITFSTMTEKRKNISFLTFLCFSSNFFSWLNIFKFSCYGMSFILCPCNCRHKNEHFDVQFRQILSVHFLSKDGKGASYERGSGWKVSSSPVRVGIFFLMFNHESTFPCLCLDLAWKQLYFPPRKRYQQEK